MANFQTALAIILAIIDEHKRVFGTPARGSLIKNVALDKAVEDFYYTAYWLRNRINEINNQEVANFAFDMVVNHGRGVMLLNRSVNKVFPGRVTADNKMKDATISGINANPGEVYKQMIEVRRAYYQSLADFDVFGQGWLNRLAKFPAAVMNFTTDVTASKKK
ncbi:MAG: hypothetical protein K2X48_07625 [Chitinophagaceae bacterium]|nr:hypothetical protein [Chitinophagaceae bacterium]